MKPYSKDLRLRVLAAVDRGLPREEVARTFSVSVPTIKRWLGRRRQTGGGGARHLPGPTAREGGRPRRVAAGAPGEQPRPHAGGAARGLRGGPRGRGGLRFHGGQG